MRFRRYRRIKCAPFPGERRESSIGPGGWAMLPALMLPSLLLEATIIYCAWHERWI